MSRFVIVKEAPAELRKEETVITMPDFMEQVAAVRPRNGQYGLSTTNHLRDILTHIGNKYDQFGFSSFTDVPVSRYTGIPMTDDAAISNLVLTMLNEHYPQMIDAYITHQIKNRPLYTKLIYFVGPVEKGKLFHLEGFAPLDVKDIESYLNPDGKKQAKKVAVNE